jgi:thymidylate synthase
MKQYLDILRDIMEYGNEEESQGDVRTGVWAKRLFHREMIFDLSDGSVPFLHTKKVPFRSTVAEMLWIMNGRNKLSDMLKHKCTFWAKWPHKNFCSYLAQAGVAEDALPSLEDYIAMITQVCVNGESTGNPAMDMFLKNSDNMGPLYGYQWRNWNSYTYLTTTPGGEELYSPNEGLDQLATVLDTLRNRPYARQETVMTSWNVDKLHEMVLPPCHACHINHYVADGKLHVKMVQRSCDMPIGVPINIAEYGVYLQIMAKLAGLQPGTLVWSGDNVHIYSNQFEGVKEQLTRTPREEMPKLILPDIKELEDLETLTPDDFSLEGYDPLPAIKYEVAV